MNFKNFLRSPFLIAFGLILLSPKTHAQGMKFFEGTWDQLKAEAKKQHKPFMVDCYTSWCGPCKMMATKIFPQKEVGDFYNANFICYSLDMEKGEGPDVSKTYGVKVYPTLIYFNPEGEMMHRVSGGLPANDLLEEGRMALDPQNNFVGRIKRFNAGEKDTVFLLELIALARYADDDVLEKALNTYWNVVPEKDLYSNVNWERFKILDNNINSPEYYYVKSHKAAFSTKYGEDEITKTLLEKAAYSIQRAAETGNEKLMKQAKAILDSSNMDDVVKFASQGELMFYKSTGDIKKFGMLARKYVDKYAKDNADELNNMAFEAATGNDDTELLHDAEKWSEQSIKIKKGYANMDIYAHILYKLGKKVDAAKTANEALAIAQQEHADPKSTNELLEKMKAEK